MVADEAKGFAQDAMFHARQAMHESRESLRSEASNQAARMATTLRDIGGQLQSMAQGQSDGVAVDVSRQLAGTATRVADRLESGGLDAALGDVKGFARRRPGLFLLGALGAGFAAGRLIKAADTHSLMEVTQQRPQQPQQITGGDGWPTPEQSPAIQTETTP
ncbi:MAG TPA: hypothetical protein VM282_26560 [Acidimicrobiales bacterium]|nr:hypothetical protein [Acidimicrobiales bacterium]